MAKQFILLLHLIGVFIYQLIFSGNVTVTQVVPSSMSINTNSLVEITVQKGSVVGFAKVQQDIPNGFSIEPVETKGATFSFKDNRVKFIWMSLPADETFTISYYIKPLDGTTGDFTLGGKFSFIDNSERVNIAITETKFSISDELTDTEASDDDTITEDLDNNDEIAIDDDTSNENTNDKDEIVATPTIEVNAKRTISDNGDGTYYVVLNITKKGVEGFAKVEEEIPTGFIAEEDNSAGGVFSFRDNTVKILWMALPKSDEITIAYLLKNTNATKGNYNINGAFSYLENDNTQAYNIDATSFILNIEDEITENIEDNSTDETDNSTTEIDNSDMTNTDDEIVLEDKIEDETKNTIENKITNTPNPETGISYKVQVGAGHQTVPTNWFAMKFNFNDEISTENHQGWIKYVVGSFDIYKSARDKRNIVRNKVKRAFVTAYNSGERITVQEALMISNQKWYK